MTPLDLMGVKPSVYYRVTFYCPMAGVIGAPMSQAHEENKARQDFVEKHLADTCYQGWTKHLAEGCWMQEREQVMVYTLILPYDSYTPTTWNDLASLFKQRFAQSSVLWTVERTWAQFTE